jgi:sugar phosphate isomerase/epimerase
MIRIRYGSRSSHVRAVRSLDDAVAFIGASGCANAALCVDALHLARSGGTPAQVAALARSQLAYVQLCDAPELLPAGQTLLDEARGGREHPGEGGLPLRELVASLTPDVALSIEVAHQRDEKRSVRERARQAAAAAHRFLASCPPPKAG